MACGLGVITSITNGTAEIITEGFDGLIVQDPSNAEELAAQIRRLCQDPNFLRRLGENAANTALRYTWDQNGEQMKEIFTSVLRRKKATDPAS
jgi:glycosyltransferase involved in cell wall biosynthesis